MRIVSSGMLSAGLALCLAMPASAQSVGVLQSAETIDYGVFKIMGAPILTFGKDGADNELGVGGRFGYGFTDRFDAEAKLGFFDFGTYIGVDGEYWIVRSEQRDTGLDFSLAGGLHWVLGGDEYFDSMGFDLTPQLSGHVSPLVELCGALDMSFETVDDVPEEFDDSYTRVHVVPGIEYKLSEKVDLVGEFGIGLNDDSWSYVGLGIAFYLR
jgi:hypothetical protein